MTAPLRRFAFRLAMLVAVCAPPLLHTGCVREAAYQYRLEQEARKHVYDVSRKKLLAEVRKAAEDDGWTVVDGEEDGPDLIGKTRTKGARKERLVVTLVKVADGLRVEADLEVELQGPNGKQSSLQKATAIEVAVLESLDSKALEKAKTKARAQSKEDARMVRACARKAVDAATDDGE